MASTRFFVCLFALVVFTGCGGGGSTYQAGPGTTFNPPSATAVLLPPPNAEQQVEQPDSPTCAPAVGTTMYRVVTGKNYSFEQTISEMHTTSSGTFISAFVNWLNDHEMSASKTALPTGWAVGMITEQIKSGYYVIPYVNENTLAGNAHVFIVYGVDGSRILISDSNKHFGSNRFAVDASTFESDWLINVGSKEAPSALLIFVSSKPKPSSGIKKETSASSDKMTYGDLLIK